MSPPRGTATSGVSTGRAQVRPWAPSTSETDASTALMGGGRLHRPLWQGARSRKE